MRSRSNSGVRLDFYQRMVQKIILKYQNPVTGLLPATPNHLHAWVRDNVYSILGVWGLALAYKKTADLDEDIAKSYELEQSVVKLMRGLLSSMMKQIEKVEKFKLTQTTTDALHAKYSVSTGKAVVGDTEWGHLQLDATSLYLLVLGQMIASGLQIIYTLDEASFIQNLVFYIQSAYRTPDYGIWERGDKTNHGLPELNATSIGMAKAALEALNELDLFGARGGPSSVIHVMSDEAQQCQAILHSVLPRESNSKETDAGLLSIISYPAFAVDDQALVDLTRETVITKLQGRYGLCRFLRDGYKTPKEDPSRLYYEPWELYAFENIECEWPIFYAYLILDGLFNGNDEQVEKYSDLLDNIMIKRDDGIKLMPELYTLLPEQVEQEYKNPKSQDRLAAGKMPHMWGQSLYVLGRLLKEGFLSPGELDPLNRRFVAEAKPDIVVQVVILAEDNLIREKLASYDIKVQTLAEVSPIQIYQASVLSHLFCHLGKTSKLGLSGRPTEVMGILATSKLYMLGNHTLAFFPQVVDRKQFYLPLDIVLLMDYLKTEIQYLGQNWKILGRPLLIFPVLHSTLDCANNINSTLISTIKKLQTGYIHGTRVNLGNLSEFQDTSCVTNLTFLTEAEDTPDLSHLLNHIERLGRQRHRSGKLLGGTEGKRKSSWSKTRRRQSVVGIIRRTCSIQIDPSELPAINSVHEQQSSNAVENTLESQVMHRFSTYDRPVSIDNPPSTSLFYKRPSFNRFSSYDLSDLSHLSGGTTPISFTARSPRLSIDLTGGSTSGDTESVSEGASEPTSPFTSSPFQNLFPITTSASEASSALRTDRQHHLRSSETSEDVSDGTVTPVVVKSYHDSDYDGIECTELVEQLQETDSLSEQADIIHYLFIAKGPDWDASEADGSPPCLVRDLLAELYERAGQMKQWWLVRHTAGMLRKQVDDLARAAADVLVRQKQLAVGLPPEPREKIITRPLPPDELSSIIQEACGEDSSTAMLTQEILVYLAMFIRTEPKLFNEMLRIRVGLIIQVMASELARTLNCSGEEASDQLLNLSPFEMKTLLHHILSGKEFGVSKATSMYPDEMQLCICSVEENMASTKKVCSTFAKFRQDKKVVDELNTLPVDSSAADQLQDSLDTDRHGQWLRRRRLDGSLNRVPIGFYEQTWQVLKRCHGLSVEGHVLPQSLTKEMTPGEQKFALQVEMVLNRIPQPEYRQLMVEAMMVLCLTVEHCHVNTTWNQTIPVDKLVHLANEIFIKEQKTVDGDVTLCCGAPNQTFSSTQPLRCGGTAGICQNFFDMAPSGRFGTMVYLSKATLEMLNFPTKEDGTLDCVIS